MARELPPIPQGEPITDRQGAITEFFRLAWQALQTAFAQSPTVGSVSIVGRTSGIATAAVYTVVSPGLYRVSFYQRKTIADGVNSSLTLTLGWVDGGIALTQAFPALATDTTSAFQTATIFVRCDAATDITYAEAYASNTPAKMAYDLDVQVELMVP